MDHSFNVEIAIMHGVDEAIVLQNLCYWQQKNKANNKHFYDGRYWAYNSLKAFQELFPYWSKRQLERILKHLEDKGCIVTGNFNDTAYDRTKWYSVSDEIFNNWCCDSRYSAISPFGEMDSTEWRNGFHQTVKPIPNNKPNNKPNIYIDNIDNIENTKTYVDFFEKVWRLYPKKRGKGQVSDTQKKKLYKIGIEEMTRAIERYKKDNADTDMQFWQNGSTFFNSGYVDYLDKNYEALNRNKYSDIKR